MDRFYTCLDITLTYEGGFSNHPSDPGGATNLGITLGTLKRWRGQADINDVKMLSKQEAGEIYRAFYWQPVKGDTLPAGLDLALFDFAVNSGVPRAVRTLQQILQVTSDGILGRQTLMAVERADVSFLVKALCQRRLAFLQGLNTWPTFGRGWQRRVEAIEKQALQLFSTLKGYKMEDTNMNETKSILASRTVWANVIGLASIVFGLAGINTSGIDTSHLADAIAQIVAAGSFIASTFFRIKATQQLGAV